MSRSGLPGSVSRRDHSISLPAGSTLVPYTDGLVETRAGDIDDNIYTLLTKVRRHPPENGPQALVDLVIGSGGPDGRRCRSGGPHRLGVLGLSRRSGRIGETAKTPRSGPDRTRPPAGGGHRRWLEREKDRGTGHGVTSRGDPADRPDPARRQRGQAPERIDARSVPASCPGPQAGE
ncbi:SpoIIE family protein phosphatase [Lapillicoccus sp.]|uniref:SpoIIE family protein phosphatase n=1 Tax=Lapillicoccus sp. TaxID=1909287 RepID=UPI003982F08C